ncbi:alcohol dehydrogenase [Oscillibacter sp. PC13]|uniref:iron-containing alcohol dehydrogenase n=1 Tax=Oscillibacter sp. PC13 TaxID=1855299 RepID=UPI0008F1D35B|nr:iron-containing alcohol dehydrogenase [Oscillibacter sp. PC13]SFP51810.1 alcohol dehydrogenase [Oscillibacter sp. PC13]
MALSKFSFPLATRIEFGEGYLTHAGAEAKKLGIKKAMVIADKGIIACGIVKPIEESLRAEHVDYVIYDQILPNPRDIHCIAGAEFAKEHQIDGMIAIGGGSSMDTAKAVGTLLTNGGNIRTWAAPAQLEHEILPLIAVPTTAGTGSEVTFDAVITDTEAHEKLNILDLKIAPKVALVDPNVLQGLPEKVMSATGVDALVHAVEAYTCKAASPITDAFALYAIDLIGANIREAVYKRTKESCRNMMLGSTMAGVAFGYSDVAGVHCIAEALGGRYDTPHGVSNAMVLSTVTEFNIPAAAEKYAEVARHLGVNTAGMTTEEAAYSCVDAMKSICADVKIPKMRDFDVINPKDFQELAEASFRNMSTPNNPREITVQDYFDLLNKAYNA